MTLPYASATSGAQARDEILRILKRFGCQSVGFMDEFDTKTVRLAFVWRGRQIQLRATAQGWANAYLKKNPWNRRRQSSKQAYEQAALDQGMIAVNSILRDWVKGQMTAVEADILTFEHVFMPFMLTNDGRPLIDRVRELKMLPGPEEGVNGHE